MSSVIISIIVTIRYHYFTIMTVITITIIATI